MSTKTFNVICGKCGVNHQVIEKEETFPKKVIYYCSRSCANSRTHSNETKQKIRNKLLVIKENNRICTNCNKCFYVKPSKEGKFCSASCRCLYRMKQKGVASSMGLKSVSTQSNRSKNEIYFADLCKQKFNSVKINEPIFNGWDADVIIEDFKLAVLWNGKWHYEKITEKHSVEQVQNRDKIKLSEIEAFGYKSYVIKDMGKHNKQFVEEKFQEMLAFLKLI